MRYFLKGQQSRVFDYSHDDNEKEFTSAECSPNGQSIAIGSYDQIRIYTWSPRQKTWIDVARKEIKNLYSVSALTWRSDGARYNFVVYPANGIKTDDILDSLLVQYAELFYYSNQS